MIKLLDANYDADGISTTKIGTELGNFIGKAYLHPDDEEIASKFLGCEIAEYRATLLYFHKKLSLLNNKLLALYDLKRDYNHIGLTDEDRGYKKLIERIAQMELQKTDYKTDIKSLKKAIDARIDSYEENLLKIRKEKEEKDSE